MSVGSVRSNRSGSDPRFEQVMRSGGKKTRATIVQCAFALFLAGYVVSANACQSSSPVPNTPDTPYLPPVPPPADGSTGSGVDIVIVTAEPCTLITARTAEETSTTCASSRDADSMARFILRQRDGGAAPTPCSTFPPTLQPLVTTCASETEVLRAIDFLSEQRRIETLRHPPPRTR